MAALGMNKKGFHIELKDNLLTITSEQNDDDSPSEDKLWLRREFSY
jgi:HSP20 family molecular chaperone IbpA